MSRVFLGFGSNMGNSEKIVLDAMRVIANEQHFQIKNRSSLYKTEPLLYKKQNDFINSVAEYSTDLNAELVLEYIHKVEKKFHRERDKKIRYGPRTLDIDILFYNDEKIETDDLQIPHTRFSERKFVLIPMAEIESNYKVDGKTIKSYLEECSDRSKVEKIK
ncbi:MAG: 2-amino-4-hydroxy-6-hydroxymethyldihydropteridine diphosphokinase [Candidatus Marinimicrobia bacterium]|nr:2-amino-4-hydroxy-6-hydroxymethyldihydropteridine diphosphokinase [Candidatus Neomarinimicrobiota bacterium]